MSLFPELDNYRGAVFSDDRVYRYLLWRRWYTFRQMRTPSPVGFLMLNPSTANETENDPTVERCEVRAREWGFNGVMVANIFAFRSTDPRIMKQFAGDPIGPANDQHILEMASKCFPVICAWGRHGEHMGRGTAVLKMLKAHGVLPWALGMNQDGSPEHPLYIGYRVRPKLMAEELRNVVSQKENCTNDNN
jgi:hypothetical protein